jgi:hypothetical protein
MKFADPICSMSDGFVESGFHSLCKHFLKSLLDKLRAGQKQKPRTKEYGTFAGEHF